MAKTKKKKLLRALVDDGLVNIGMPEEAANADDGGNASIEDCLGQMWEQQVSSPIEPKVDDAVDDAALAAPSQRDKDDGATVHNKSKVMLKDNKTFQQTQQQRRLQEWQWGFAQWQGPQHSYTPGLLPAFDLEVGRHCHIQELSSFLLSQCPQLRMPAFERWLLDAKLEEEAQATAESRRKRPRPSSTFWRDPILASQPASLKATERLQREVMAASDLSLKKATVLMHELCRRTTAAVLELQHKHQSQQTLPPLHKGDRLTVQNDDDDGDASRRVVVLVFHRKRWTQPFRIRLNRTHYDKLQRAFLQAHRVDSLQDNNRGGRHKRQRRTIADVFHLLVMTLTLRYSSLAGGQLLRDQRGGGMQGAVHEHVFDVLQQSPVFGGGDCVLLEGMASPFNCHNNGADDSGIPYASAFGNELEFHFGSVGTFADLVRSAAHRHHNVVCQVNPPFCPGVMDAVVAQILRALKTVASQSTAVLSFVVVVPTCHHADDDDTAAVSRPQEWARSSFQRLESSAFCSAHWVLPARQHGYVEGAQHLRPTRYKESSYDTSVFVLQSSSQPQQDEQLKVLEAQVSAAFASRHEQELAARRRSGEAKDKEVSEETSDSD